MTATAILEDTTLAALISSKICHDLAGQIGAINNGLELLEEENDEDTRYYALELIQKGVRMNAIAPGYVETNNTTALRADAERNADILKRIPAGRWARPEDMAGAAVFLASPASDYVHGVILPVDGGWLAR